MELEVCVSFRRARGKWKTYCYDIEVENLTREEIAEKVTERIVEEWRERNPTIRDVSVIERYREKVYEAIEQALTNYVIRTTTRRIQLYIERLGDVAEKILAAARVASRKEMKRPVLGMNTVNYVFLDFDTRRGAALYDAVALAEIVYDLYCRKCPRKWVIIQTRRGFHLMVGLKLSYERWKRFYMFLREECPTFTTLDCNYVEMVLERDYATLSLGDRKTYIKRLGDVLHVSLGMYKQYRRVIENIAETLGVRLIVE